MKFVKNVLIASKTIPKGVWIAAVILPFGFTVLGLWIALKSLFRRKHD